METKMKKDTGHNYRVGDVFLEKDGWGKVIISPEMGGVSNVYTFARVNTATFAIAHHYFTDVKTNIDKETFLFNICDLFTASRKALDEDTNT